MQLELHLLGQLLPRPTQKLIYNLFDRGLLAIDDQHKGISEATREFDAVMNCRAR